jgi:hypothetical protein
MRDILRRDFNHMDLRLQPFQILAALRILNTLFEDLRVCAMNKEVQSNPSRRPKAVKSSPVTMVVPCVGAYSGGWAAGFNICPVQLHEPHFLPRRHMLKNKSFSVNSACAEFQHLQSIVDGQISEWFSSKPWFSR